MQTEIEKGDIVIFRSGAKLRAGEVNHIYDSGTLRVRMSDGHLVIVKRHEVEQISKE